MFRHLGCSKIISTCSRCRSPLQLHACCARPLCREMNETASEDLRHLWKNSTENHSTSLLPSPYAWTQGMPLRQRRSSESTLEPPSPPHSTLKHLELLHLPCPEDCSRDRGSTLVTQLTVRIGAHSTISPVDLEPLARNMPDNTPCVCRKRDLMEVSGRHTARPRRQLDPCSGIALMKRYVKCCVTRSEQAAQVPSHSRKPADGA